MIKENIMNKKRNFKLDAEEQELSDSFDRGEWKTVANLKQKIAFAKKAAADSLRKNARINIRLSDSDLIRIKQKAAFEMHTVSNFNC